MWRIVQPRGGDSELVEAGDVIEQRLRQRDRFAGWLTPADHQSEPAAASDMFRHDRGHSFQPGVALHHLWTQQTAAERDHLNAGHRASGGEGVT